MYIFSKLMNPLLYPLILLTTLLFLITPLFYSGNEIPVYIFKLDIILAIALQGIYLCCFLDPLAAVLENRNLKYLPRLRREVWLVYVVSTGLICFINAILMARSWGWSGVAMGFYFEAFVSFCWVAWRWGVKSTAGRCILQSYFFCMLFGGLQFGGIAGEPKFPEILLGQGTWQSYFSIILLFGALVYFVLGSRVAWVEGVRLLQPKVKN